MASVGDQFFCPEDFTSPVVFPFEAGASETALVLHSAAITFHSPLVVNVTVDLPAGREGTRRSPRCRIEGEGRRGFISH